MANTEVLKFYGIRETIQVMQQFEPEMYKQFRKDIRTIVAPAVSSVKSSVPNVAPLSGMVHGGRTAWSGVSAGTSITPMQRSKGFGSTTSNLIAITATGNSKQFGFNIADMAGRGSGYGRRPKAVTRQYVRNGRTMQHRLNGQGQAMIRNLEKQPSRYFYPSIEKQLPSIINGVNISLYKWADTMGRKLKIVG